MRATGGALAAAAVVLTASGASLVTPQEPAVAAEDVTALAVAAVWRSAGTADSQAAADAPEAVLAEVAAARDGGSTSRSLDRVADPVTAATSDGAAAAGDGATATRDGATAGASGGPETSATVPSATGSSDTGPSDAASSDAASSDPAADAVAQAAAQVQALVGQQAADTADTAQAAAAAATSAAAARAAVEAAQAQRDAEAAAAALAAAQADPRPLAEPMVAERGWDAAQFQCLDRLWTKESGWRWSADNPTSSAYGIPQSLPGQKMAAAGADWETNPVTQISWGLGYIADAYGTPCRAWAHSQSYDWY